MQAIGKKQNPKPIVFVENSEKEFVFLKGPPSEGCGSKLCTQTGLPCQMKPSTKTCGPYPGCCILIHTHIIISLDTHYVVARSTGIAYVQTGQKSTCRLLAIRRKKEKTKICGFEGATKCHADPWRLHVDASDSLSQSGRKKRTRPGQPPPPNPAKQKRQ